MKNDLNIPLVFAHLSKLQEALGDKAESDAEVSRIKKLAKADGIAAEDLAYIVGVIKADDVQIEIDRMKRRTGYLEALGIIPKDQADMFADRRPNDESSHDAGYCDGLLGKNCESERGSDYVAGWEAGQSVLATGFKAMEKPAATLVVNNEGPFADNEPAAAKSH